jgi:hypothetical protein
MSIFTAVKETCKSYCTATMSTLVSFTTVKNMATCERVTCKTYEAMLQ